MRAFFSNEDMKNLLVDVFNENTIDVTLIDEETKEETQSDMVSYLDVDFYTWWQHVQTAAEELMQNGGNVRESWKRSLNWKVGKSYALIEQLDEETIQSQDISGATIMGRITFMVDPSKITNLEYYLRYLKSQYTGKAIKREACDGSMVAGYLTLGILLYDQEPQMTQVGEVIVATLNWKFNYLTLAGTYDDISLEISLNGNVDTNYKTLQMIKYSWQNIFTKQAVPTASRVDLAGVLVTAISHSVTISYYDFDKEINSDLDELFWDLNAIEIDGNTQGVRSVNIPAYLRITIGTKKRVYKCVITDMQKAIVNNEFTISSITLNGWGKVGA